MMACTVFVTYLLLKRLRDEKTAMIGSLLTLFTPIALVMLNRIYMDTYAAMSFMAIGGGLYFYYHLERENLGVVKGGVLLFLGVFFTLFAVVTRYTNAPIAIVIGLHYIITRIVDWQRGHGTGLKFEVIPLIFGVVLPVAGILLYDKFIFGSPFKDSYSFSPYPIKFAFQYIGQSDADGSIPLQILTNNWQGMYRNVLIAFPLLFIGIPGFIYVLVQKIIGSSRPNSITGRWSGIREEMPWDIFLVLAGWFICVFGLYLGYEWTAGLKQGGGMVVFDRFLVPGLFPIVIITALIITRFPVWAMAAALVLLIAFGVMFYLQWDYNNIHILPQWVTMRTLESRWPNHIFPPWTSWEKTFGAAYGK